MAVVRAARLREHSGEHANTRGEGAGDALLSFAGFAAVPLSPAANHTCEIQAFALLVPYHDTYHIIEQNQD